jgi:RNA polymerase sigma-70 factor (ECF subfamily)
MNSHEWQAEQFERSRTHLRAVAYRMLGSIPEADDAIQEAWLRVSRSDTERVENMRGWLTTVVSRICLDMLRARRSRREELGDDRIPEPVVSIDDSSHPEQQALIADSVGLAMLVVLEMLSPAERLAFVLHDMFGMPFEEIAPIVERNVEATRQLASRARRRVRGAEEPEARSLSQQRRVVSAFLAASRNGDFEALLAILDPDVVFRADRVGAFAPGIAEVTGREVVASRILERGAPLAHLARPAIVNGGAGLVVASGDRVLAVVAFHVAGDHIAEIDLYVDPATVRRVRV